MPSRRAITDGLFSEGPEGPRLIAGRCTACGKLHFPAAELCPYCGAEGCAPRPVGPAGRLRLYTAVLSRPPGYRGEVPYGFGVVELEDGLQVITRLTEAHLALLRPGLAVSLVVEPLFTDDDGNAVMGYAFRPEPS